MAIDIRATVTCSLGTLISASVSDDYVQGTGLIKTKGSCELSGIYTPDLGTAVTFSYTQDGVTRQVPRKLRVMSSFADPFRRTTKVELGCKLTYLSDLQEPVDWTAFDDPGNASLSEADARIVTIPIRASSVMDKCLTELGITADNNPLTSKFSVANFDLGPGYVTVLSDLLVSESYCGYLDTDEVLKVFSLDQDGGTGPAIDATSIIDLGSIGVGQLPGEAVVVSYSTLKLKKPEKDDQADEETLWEREEIVGETTTYPVSYTKANGDTATKKYTGHDVTLNETKYQEITLYKQLNSTTFAYTGKTLNVVASKTTTVTSPSIKGEGAYVAARLSADASYYNYDITSQKTEVIYSYDKLGEQTGVETREYEPGSFAVGRLGLPWVVNDTFVSIGRTLYPISVTKETTVKAADFTRNVSSRYVWWPLSQAGQQAVAEMRDTFKSAAEVQAYAEYLLNYAGLVHEGTEITTRQMGLGLSQGRPTTGDLVAARNADGGDPNNGWRTEGTAELELALGSATAQRRIEFNLPYPPDDVFSGPSGGPFTTVASDAAAVATRYGRCQNRLLLGNRSGMNLQMAAPQMPSAPFAPFVVQANGLSALYRTNGTSWQMDASGILASTDALFWGAVGGTGTFWFPVAPGITTLPTTPAVVDGEMTVDSTVAVWNETVLAVGKTSTKLEVTSLSYALSLLTEVAVTTRTALAVTRILKVEAPAADVSVAGVVPAVSIGVALRPPAADVAVAGAVPAVSTATVVQVPAADVAVAGAAPSVSASLTVVLVPAANVTVAGATPDLQAGDDYYTNLATQFWTLLRDWRVDWWGD